MLPENHCGYEEGGHIGLPSWLQCVFKQQANFNNKQTLYTDRVRCHDESWKRQMLKVVSKMTFRLP